MFALKKLNAINPEILREQEKRLLLPSAPGVITSLIHGGLMCSAAVYTGYIWRSFGLKGFANPQAVIPLGAIIGSSIVFQWSANRLRELSLSGARKKLVTLYSDRYGSNFLLDVLEPSFRLPESMQAE